MLNAYFKNVKKVNPVLIPSKFVKPGVSYRIRAVARSRDQFAEDHMDIIRVEKAIPSLDFSEKNYTIKVSSTFKLIGKYPVPSQIPLINDGSEFVAWCTISKKKTRLPQDLRSFRLLFVIARVHGFTVRTDWYNMCPAFRPKTIL